MFKEIEFDRSLLKYKTDQNVKRRFMNWYELDIICYYAQITKGNILEIGCNTGETTLELSKARPYRNIYAVDTYKTENINQEYERPDEICKHAKNQNNVVVFERKSNDLDYRYIDVTFAFLDGDHRYKSIEYDFNQLYPKCDYILLHDYIKDNNHPWVGTKKFVDDNKDKYNIVHFKNTILILIYGGLYEYS